MAWGTITSPHSTTSTQFGGDMGNKLAKLFSNVDVSQSPYDTTDIPKINTPFQFRSTVFQLLNPAQSFVYKFVTSAIAANINITVPLATYDTSLPLLGVNQTFTEGQEVLNDSSNLLELTRPVNTVNTVWGIDFWAKDSVNNFQQYGAIQLQIKDNVNATEDSDLLLKNIIGGTLKSGVRVGSSGVALGSNLRARITDSGLTAERAISFQDADTVVAGTNLANTFLAGQMVKLDTSGPLLELYRPVNAGSSGCRLDFELQNSTPAQKTYSRILGAIDTNTAGSEVGHFEVWNILAGTLTKCVTFDTNGNIALERGLVLEGVLSPSQITSNQNDYNPTNNASNVVERLNADLHGRRVTGLAGGTDGMVKILLNVGTKDIILTNQDTGSTTAGDRFLFGNNHILYPDTCLPIIYDGTTARWRLLGQTRIGTTNLRTRTPLYTDFLRETQNGFPPFDNVAVSSGTAVALASASDHLGVIQCVSSTTANSGYSARSSNIALNISGGEAFECIMRFPGFTNNTVRIGLHDATSSTAPVDGVYFEMNGSSTVTGKTMSNSVGSTTGTSFTASTNVWYRLKIIVSSTSRVDFYIYDESGAELWKDSLTANIPTGASRDTGICAIGTNSTTTGSIATLDLDYMAFFPGYIDALVR